MWFVGITGLYVHTEGQVIDSREGSPYRMHAMGPFIVASSDRHFIKKVCTHTHTHTHTHTSNRLSRSVFF